MTVRQKDLGGPWGSDTNGKTLKHNPNIEASGGILPPCRPFLYSVFSHLDQDDWICPSFFPRFACLWRCKRLLSIGILANRSHRYRCTHPDDDDSTQHVARCSGNARGIGTNFVVL